jgi:hypothetical protein
MTLQIVDSTQSHLRQLSKTLRVEDRNEILALGMSPEKALSISYKNAIYRKTAFIDEKVAAVWGVSGNFMGEVGTPYLLTSTEVVKITPLLFVRIYKYEVEKMLEIFSSLENYVDVNYTSAVRLLKMIGFTVGEPQKIESGMFCKFQIKR